MVIVTNIDILEIVWSFKKILICPGKMLSVIILVIILSVTTVTKLPC